MRAFAVYLLICLSAAALVWLFPASWAQAASDSGSKFSIFGWGKSDDDTSNTNKEDDQQSGTPNTLNDASADDDSELEGTESPPPIEISPQGPAIQRVPWQKTEFGSQANALGLKSDAFAIPDGFQERVAFWVSIYAKYTTNQGVLHDTLYPSVVYESLDFADIVKDNRLNGVRKRHSRERLIKDHKAAIVERLLRLQRLSSSEGLQGEDLHYWKMFERYNSPTKFVDATKKGRLRFQLGQKDRFALGIYYSGRYLNEMERIFREENLPLELTRLPFVESSFNIYARSRVGASGIWQFMRRTARPYMMVNSAVDERNDPLRATRSAAKLLRANYDLLGSWPLALTGWNHGPNGLLKIIKKTGTRELPKIIEMYSSRRFGFASENFYACFLAALEVERHAHKYFGDVKWSVPLEHSEIHLSKPVPYEAVHIWFNGDDELAQLYNPHFSKGVRRGRQSMPRGTNVRIPKVMEPFATAYIDGQTSLQKMRESIAQANIKVAYPTALTQTIANAAMAPKATPMIVASSGSGSSGGAKAGSSSGKVPATQALGTPSATATSKVIATSTPASALTASPTPSLTPSISPKPTSSPAGASPAPSASPSASPSSTPDPLSTPALAEKLAGVKEDTRPKEYKVVRGDKLIKIAKMFGLSKAQLKEANPSIGKRDRIRLGQTLVIPPLAPGAASSSAGSDTGADAGSASPARPTLLPEPTPVLIAPPPTPTAQPTSTPIPSGSESFSN